MAVVQTWIDSFGETVKFKYDEDGFPVISDYERLNRVKTNRYKCGNILQLKK